MQNVSILGCGWLGLELAKTIALEGYSVMGSSRSTQGIQHLLDVGIPAYVYEIGQQLPPELLAQTDAVIMAFPLPKTLTLSDFERFSQQLYNTVPERCRVIFTSSTSVYTNRDERLDEGSSNLDPTNANYRMEQALRAVFGQRLTVLRLGGLIGEDRHPVVHLSGRTSLANGNAPVNLVHRRDVIRFISLLLKNMPEQTTYNLVYPLHPSRSEYYINKASELQLPLPHFKEDATGGKRISSDASLHFKGFDYQFPI